MSMNSSCTQIHTLIFLTTTYMIVMFFHLFINEGHDAKIITCMSNKPWKCNGRCHPCYVIHNINMENKIVKGHCLLHFCAQKSKVRHNQQGKTDLQQQPKFLNLLNYQTYALNRHSSLSSSIAMFEDCEMQIIGDGARLHKGANMALKMMATFSIATRCQPLHHRAQNDKHELQCKPTLMSSAIGH